jgi:hypothetical protein
MMSEMLDSSLGTQPRTSETSGLTAALRTYLSTEAGSAAVLLGAALIALARANSPCGRELRRASSH